MPRRDRTGPIGAGPVTGRGLGNCTEVSAANYGTGLGLGLAHRRGFGRGYARRSYAADNLVDTNTAKLTLERRKSILKNRLQEINEQLESL